MEFSDRELQSLYFSLLKEAYPRQRYGLEAVFYRTRSLRHTIELRRGLITVRVAESFRQVPEYILKALGLILLAKLFRHKPDPEQRSIYRAYINNNLALIHKPQLRQPSKRYTAQGKYYNLETIFEALNEKYFSNRLQKPLLGWSLNPSYRRLGFYVQDKNLLVISRIFDSSKVPIAVVEYLVYHEMLHMYFPVKTTGQRRVIHSRQFRLFESRFPGFEDIQNWLKKKRSRL